MSISACYAVFWMRPAGVRKFCCYVRVGLSPRLSQKFPTLEINGCACLVWEGRGRGGSGGVVVRSAAGICGGVFLSKILMSSRLATSFNVVACDIVFCCLN